MEKEGGMRQIARGSTGVRRKMIILRSFALWYVIEPLFCHPMGILVNAIALDNTFTIGFVAELEEKVAYCIC